MKSVLAAALCVLAGTASAFAQAPAETSIPQPGTVLPPSVLKEVKPVYPDEAMAEGRSGTVTLECVVNADGSVGEVQVLTPLEPSLDAEAIKALKQWQFKPGTKDGKAVPVAVTVEMSFSLRAKGPLLDSPEVFKPGDGVTTPKAVKEVKPRFLAYVIRSGVSGSVEVECVVLPDGTVGDARVKTRLHPDLDAEALTSVRQWRFEPGTKEGKPVPVQVTIEMTFTLR